MGTWAQKVIQYTTAMPAVPWSVPKAALKRYRKGLGRVVFDWRGPGWGDSAFPEPPKPKGIFDHDDSEFARRRQQLLRG